MQDQDKFQLLHDLYGYIEGIKYSTSSCMKLLENKDYDKLKALLDHMAQRQESSELLKERLKNLLGV